MNKAERLFQLVTLLRGRRLAVTAKTLSEMLEVSQRTIYRDIQALILSGIPIEGEAGVGYLLPSTFELPPLMFSADEILALILGSDMVKAWSDKMLARSATSAIAKISAVLPDELKIQAEKNTLLVPDFHINEELSTYTEVIRAAINDKHVLQLIYRDVKKDQTTRNIEPLSLVYWGGKWTMICFCQLRTNYREFRLDRITQLTRTQSCFELAGNKNIDHYLATMSKEDRE